MELTTMTTTRDIHNMQSRLSSLLRRRILSQPKPLPRKPTILNPALTVVSSPPKRLEPSPLIFDLEARAVYTLSSLRNSNGRSLASDYISENVRVQNDEDNETVLSREEFLSSWDDDLDEENTTIFDMEVLEAAVDESQRKVWVRSELRERQGPMRKESVDMITFGSDGLLTACIGSQRVVSR